jgi:eukaryotic-like serine/threonine-protein kinase
MGEVYRARDPRLGREVAIKVLPSTLAGDEVRRRRFLQEARAASALNHPNIVSVFELESADGVDFIVMEQVSGRTLDAVIRSGLRLPEALRIALSVADALAGAHAAGIVHRDLKPANVMVTAEGGVKVLDFGLAKLVDSGLASGEDETTLSEVDRPSTLTRSGVIAGTPGYMSPEQATGGKVDARSDVFAFGSLLYELATGQRAFSGTTREETLRAVIGHPAKAPREVVPAVSEQLEKLILRCLRKEPERRFQHMSDVKVELQEILEEMDAAWKAPSASSRLPRWLRAVAGLAITALAAAGGWQAWRSVGMLPQPRLVPLTTYKGYEGQPSLSPDGEQVAFSWEGEGATGGRRPVRHIWIKPIGDAEHRQLTSGPGTDCCPSWSPDGRQIAFLRFANASATPAIYVVSQVGGAERKLVDYRAVGPQIDWTMDSRGLVVARAGVGKRDDPASGAIHLVSLSGEPPRILTRPVEGGRDRSPSVSPDGRRLAYASCLPKPALVPCHVQVVDLSQGTQPKRLTKTPTLIAGLAWAPDGKSVVYGADSSPGRQGLWRVDAEGSRPVERIELTSHQVATQPFASGRRRRLAFVLQRDWNQIWAMDAPGSSRPFLASRFGQHNPSYSPDGRRIAFASGRSGDNNEIWLADADGSNLVRLTNGLGWWQGTPRWSPDGRLIVFDSHGEDGYADVWTIDVAGGPPHRVTSGPLSEGQAGWFPDGRSIYYREDRLDGSDIWRIPEAGGTPERLTFAGGFNPRVLSDGRTLLYTRRRGPSPLVERDLRAGTEKQVLDCVFGAAFDVVRQGLYYVGCEDQEPDVPLYRLDRASGRRELLARLSTDADSFGVSPRGWPILYEKAVKEADLMLIEDFR